jgi:hypothetical protein
MRKLIDEVETKIKNNSSFGFGHVGICIYHTLLNVVNYKKPNVK